MIDVAQWPDQIVIPRLVQPRVLDANVRPQPYAATIPAVFTADRPRSPEEPGLGVAELPTYCRTPHTPGPTCFALEIDFFGSCRHHDTLLRVYPAAWPLVVGAPVRGSTSPTVVARLCYARRNPIPPSPFGELDCIRLHKLSYPGVRRRHDSSCFHYLATRPPPFGAVNVTTAATISRRLSPRCERRCLRTTKWSAVRVITGRYRRPLADFTSQLTQSRQSM